MRSGRVLLAASVAVLFGVLPLVAGHEDDGMSMDTDVDMSGHHAGAGPSQESTGGPPSNYFRYAHHAGWIYAHIATMIISWCIVLPLAIMLSVARSRFHLPGQVVFHIVNGLGMFTGFVYNHSTPDLYKHNAHHPIGWVVTSLTIAWTLMSFFVAYNEYKHKQAGRPSVTAHAMAHHNRWQSYSDNAAARYSRDSGHGTERNSMSLLGSRQNSQDSFSPKPETPDRPAFDHDDDAAVEPERNGLLGNNRVDRFISRNVHRIANSNASKAMRVSQIVIEKLLLLLGFLALATGFITWGGLFKAREVFSGAAHFVKGGIFFWYGLLTLGRWMGAFSEFGWAWNIRLPYPLVSRWKTRIPSAEFTESFVIFLYGASNVFLEHLNAWGKAWTHQDFEHVSITLLFFGGGLLGMMIESSTARNLMNTTVELQQKDREEHEVENQASTSRPHNHANGARSEQPHDPLFHQPNTTSISLNPLPGLVIMLLGIMMSSHHQASMVSTMMHAQWGTLFVGFAFSRAITYIILYIKPPTSHYPARPPSELIASFCLTAGGLMFMFSARDSVNAVEGVGLDAMTVFTVTMGLSALVMAWVVLCFAVKGWAVRREKGGE